MLHLGTVEDHYAELFEEAPSLSGPGSLVFTGTENDPETLRTLTRAGIHGWRLDLAAIRAWHAGRARAMRSTRARELLTELMPTLLQALGRSPQPDEAFARFDAFLHALPAGVQLFSLLYSNPGLLDLIAEIMGGAPRLADHLEPQPRAARCRARHRFLRGASAAARGAGRRTRPPARSSRDLQDVLDIARRWTRDRQFQLGVQMLRGNTDADRAAGPLSDVAETVIAALQPRVEAAFSHQHGRLPGRGIVTVALGQARRPGAHHRLRHRPDLHLRRAGGAGAPGLG